MCIQSRTIGLDSPGDIIIVLLHWHVDLYTYEYVV
jgi:hypothetical protein